MRIKEKEGGMYMFQHFAEEILWWNEIEVV
jgi:hypothetical protein